MLIRRTNMIYFAFPKCGTKWLQQELRQRGNNRYSPLWDDCDIGFYHVEPMRFIRTYQIDTSKHVLFTIVRNTYARLVSSWAYGQKVGNSYAKYDTFDRFVEYLYANKNRLRSLPFCWMFLPVDMYFQGVLDQVMFFQLENLDELIQYVHEHAKKTLTNRVVNANAHKPYQTYYTPKSKLMVDEMYAYEIERFNYSFE